MNHAQHLEECIRQCIECRDECQRTLFNYCLDMGGPHVDQTHVKLMMDCIQICGTAADFMQRKSNNHAVVCQACAEICTDCANSCDRIGDKTMEHCAELCRECAKHCGKMGEMRHAA